MSNCLAPVFGVRSARATSVCRFVDARHGSWWLRLLLGVWSVCALAMPAAWGADQDAGWDKRPLVSDAAHGGRESRRPADRFEPDVSPGGGLCKGVPAIACDSRKALPNDGAENGAVDGPPDWKRHPVIPPVGDRNTRVMLQRLVLRMELGGARVRPGDQFTVQLLQGIRVVASVTTTGEGIAVPSGSTGGIAVRAGVTYTLGETMAPGAKSTLAQYDTQVICKNRRPQGSKVNHIVALGQPIVLKSGDDVLCRIRNSPKPPLLTVSVRSMGGVDTFSYHGSSNAHQMNLHNGYAIQTGTEGTWHAGRQVALLPTGELVEIEQLTPPGWRILEARCTDANAAVTGNPTGYFGGLVRNTLDVPQVYLKPAADLRCGFTNVEHSPEVSGKIFLDVGGDLGVAHDGLQSVTEAGQSGVLSRLTDCGAIVFSQSITRSDGSFSLSAVGATQGQQLCVQQQVPVGYRAVSVGAGTTRSVSGDTDTQLRFTYSVGATYTGLLFGNAPVSSLSGGGTKTVSAGAGVRYVHIYTAGSSGSVQFDVEGLDHGADPDWRAAVYLDLYCGGALVPDSRLQGALDVTAGQKLCLLVHVDSPGHAVAGSTYRTRLRARETWLTPTLGHDVRDSMETIDVSRVATLGLTLRKAWRGVARCPVNGDASLADRTSFSLTGPVTPGQMIEYRLTYSNQTDGPLHDLTVFDAIPAFTVFEQAYCVERPARGIDTCAITQQPALGSPRGVVQWSMTDAKSAVTGLQPQDRGSVGYCLRLQP